MEKELFDRAHKLCIPIIEQTEDSFSISCAVSTHELDKSKLAALSKGVGYESQGMFPVPIELIFKPTGNQAV
ncbi:hypothetical protein [Paenibacillus terrae]|uniref:hypothetical protein n=1 Tax=Paenibacillus terrae TaxID=159743 RepID=UPI001656879E|nr:hypothetical protein [Paenibacillus terrae]